MKQGQNSSAGDPHCYPPWFKTAGTVYCTRGSRGDSRHEIKVANKSLVA